MSPKVIELLEYRGELYMYHVAKSLVSCDEDCEFHYCSDRSLRFEPVPCNLIHRSQGYFSKLGDMRSISLFKCLFILYEFDRGNLNLFHYPSE